MNKALHPAGPFLTDIDTDVSNIGIISFFHVYAGENTLTPVCFGGYTDYVYVTVIQASGSQGIRPGWHNDSFIGE